MMTEAACLLLAQIHHGISVRQRNSERLLAKPAEMLTGKCQIDKLDPGTKLWELKVESMPLDRVLELALPLRGL